tara:strand:- start:4388 stop:5035 length:648 start_codon:yes stop_codon:yes gene_type:complete
MVNYKNKYLKYKLKYEKIKQTGGVNCEDITNPKICRNMVEDCRYFPEEKKCKNISTLPNPNSEQRYSREQLSQFLNRRPNLNHLDSIPEFYLRRSADGRDSFREGNSTQPMNISNRDELCNICEFLPENCKCNLVDDCEYCHKEICSCVKCDSCKDLIRDCNCLCVNCNNNRENCSCDPIIYCPNDDGFTPIIDPFNPSTVYYLCCNNKNRCTCE